MMESQGKRIENVPIAEPRSLLPCSTDVLRGSALGFAGQEPVEELLDQLAELIVQVYFYEKQHTE
jgi:hypothetical protein